MAAGDHTRTRAAPDTAALVETYRAADGAFFFSTGRHTLTARGVGRRIDAREGTRDAAGIAGRMAAALRGSTASGRPIAVGAIPFRTDAPCALHIPAAATWCPATPLPHAGPPQAPRHFEVVAEPPPAQYERGVRTVLARMAAGELDKVVLARSALLTAEAPVEVRRLLRNLLSCDPHAYVFALGLPGTGPHVRTLVGSSPELLVSRRGRTVVAGPLAGSAARGADAAQDRERARALLTSAKERYEHALVVEAVAAALRPYCAALTVPAGPSLARTRAMWHLSSRVSGQLDDPGTSSLALAMALHPTPAVCGTPTGVAQETIAEIEGDLRGYYAGAVGWCDAEGDGEWALAIRCAEIRHHAVRLFAGAGIVPASQPAAELAETSAKFRTMLRALETDAGL